MQMIVVVLIIQRSLDCWTIRFRAGEPLCLCPTVHFLKVYGQLGPIVVTTQRLARIIFNIR